MMDVFSIRNYYKVLEYDNLKECWWLVLGWLLKSGLRALSSDNELLEMCFHATNNNEIVHVYLEHGVSELEVEEPTTIYRIQPTTTPPVQPIQSPPTQPTSSALAHITSSPPIQTTSKPRDKHLTNPASKAKSNPIKNSIPTTTIVKNSTLTITKKSKSTPKISATKKTTTSLPRRVTRLTSRFAPKGKKAAGKVVTMTLSSSESNDFYESAEDELYIPGPEIFENLSDYDFDLRWLRQGLGSNSDEDINLGYVLGKVSDVQKSYDAFDAYHDDSDGNDSWHSEEMKILPNSNEESDVDNDDDAFPMFIEGARFGELKLEIKTFNNDHICARRTKNMAANRKWLAFELVKNIRKYHNIKHGEASDYFKQKCDLDLNKSSLTRALTDARNIVYGNVAT
ncbi:hypothetical protein Ahy_A08g038582 [Arachis hypogaea]|uniref:PB1-like domain-containing protein n=1 Tax=Arachis hypogaea TaxID=3818 RepID=A0A445BTT2_ARAHY|nr:hypothetical protein Ahy_A08g038582 [Arachis hypogaea]